MNFTDYLIPVDPVMKQKSNPGNIGNTILLYEDIPEFHIPENVNLAILGIPEDRFSDSAGEIKSPEQVRKQLYNLSMDNAGNIIDLGNIRTGKTLSDTYFGISHILTELYDCNIVTLIIGGTKDVFYGNCLAAGKGATLTMIDPHLRFPVYGNDPQPFNSLIFGKNDLSLHVCNIGYQSYYVSQQDIENYKKNHFETYRLGEAKAGNIRDCEPVIRDSDLILLSMNSVKHSDAPAASEVSPNGFTGEEICQLSFYAGLGNCCRTFGIFDMIPHNDMQYITSRLAAQVSWYFFEGVRQRNTDHPKNNPSHFKKYVIYFDQLHHNLCFYKNIKTERWWMEVPSLKNEKLNKIIACTYDDYIKSTEQEIPDRWWKTYQRIN